MALHRKYRPKTINEIIGNEDIKKQLRSILKNAHTEDMPLPQFILITGKAGTGKTTLARVIAKQYLCQDPTKTGLSCNKCSYCQELDTYIETGYTNNENVQEVDITAENKKSNIEDILQLIESGSNFGKWRVYVLDEVHMMTNSAQNRLLKTLEEPPENVLIIMTTTNPEKILGTIKSRCQYIFETSRPSDYEMIELLNKICKEEGYPTGTSSEADELQTKTLIVKNSNHNPRKLLINLEQIIAQNPTFEYAKTLEIYKDIGANNYFKFMGLLRDGESNPLEYLQFVNDIKEQIEIRVFVDNLIVFLREAIYAYGKGFDGSLSEEDLEQYQELFVGYSLSEIITVLDVMLEISEIENQEDKLIVLGLKGYGETIRTRNYVKTQELLADIKELKAEINNEVKVLGLELKEKSKKEQEEKEKLDQQPKVPVEFNLDAFAEYKTVLDE